MYGLSNPPQTHRTCNADTETSLPPRPLRYRLRCPQALEQAQVSVPPLLLRSRRLAKSVAVVDRRMCSASEGAIMPMMKGEDDDV